jgi:hypothetical protein
MYNGKQIWRNSHIANIATKAYCSKCYLFYVQPSAFKFLAIKYFLLIIKVHSQKIF